MREFVKSLTSSREISRGVQTGLDIGLSVKNSITLDKANQKGYLVK